MDILVVGGGGREHAIIKQLRKNPQVDTIYALPGNGGIAADAVCQPIAAMDLDQIVNFAQLKQVDFAVVAPDDPLVAGLVDRLEAIGIPCFGPTQRAAMIEGSKSFAKRLMQKYHIPTAAFAVFDEQEAALRYLAEQHCPIVIKADGLALGKGVIIAATQEDAQAAVIDMMSGQRFGKSGARVVIEEFLTGPEVSVLAFCDGKTVRPMVSSMDHKRALGGDQGLNTGGMGTIAPNPYYTPEIAARCMAEIFQPTVDAMAAEGRPFCGCLYFGLMLTPDGPKVIEYNCRFGDPEAQVVLPLLETDLLEIMFACREGRLAEQPVSFRAEYACCLVVASGGYPQQYRKGLPIEFGDIGDAIVYHAGTRATEYGLETAGGRVLGLTCVASSLRGAIDAAYRAVEGVHFDGMYYRRDIGARALEAGGRG